MAIFRPGPTVTAISGALGGTIYRTGKRGNVLAQRPRRRKTPVPEQWNAQNRLQALSHAWADLTDDQRRQWRVAAEIIPTANRLGVSRPRSGFQWFIYANLHFGTFGHSLTATPPGLSLPIPSRFTNTTNVAVSNSTWTLTFTAGIASGAWIQVIAVTQLDPREHTTPRIRRITATGETPAGLSTFNVKTGFEQQFPPAVEGQTITWGFRYCNPLGTPKWTFPSPIGWITGRVGP